MSYLISSGIRSNLGLRNYFFWVFECFVYNSLVQLVYLLISFHLRGLKSISDVSDSGYIKWKKLHYLFLQENAQYFQYLFPFSLFFSLFFFSPLSTMLIALETLSAWESNGRDTEHANYLHRGHKVSERQVLIRWNNCNIHSFLFFLFSVFFQNAHKSVSMFPTKVVFILTKISWWIFVV